MASLLGLQLSSCASLSFSSSLSSPANCLSLPTNFSLLSLNTASPPPRKSFVIRMGGGPRTYPGGVSKWQWKRMQAKKQKQLLKARLCRERQIYEMRKRAELKAAVAELERPWEPVTKPPNLFSVSADEQVKVLADRFQRPGGFDLWTDRDGPQLFETVDDLPSARFFPKGVVHSVKPYGSVARSVDSDGEEDNSQKNDGIEDVVAPRSGGNRRNPKHGGRRLRKRIGMESGERREGDMIRNRVGGDKAKNRGSHQVYDMSMQKDGSYKFGS